MFIGPIVGRRLRVDRSAAMRRARKMLGANAQHSGCHAGHLLSTRGRVRTAWAGVVDWFIGTPYAKRPYHP
jgi:hypothetical protein